MDLGGEGELVASGGSCTAAEGELLPSPGGRGAIASVVVVCLGGEGELVASGGSCAATGGELLPSPGGR